MNTIKIDIKKLHEDAVIPTYGTEGAAGFDFYSIDDYVCPLGTEAVIYYDKDTGELLKITTRTIL